MYYPTLEIGGYIHSVQSMKPCPIKFTTCLRFKCMVLMSVNVKKILMDLQCIVLPVLL